MNCKKGMATFLALAVAANATGAPVRAESSFLDRIGALERLGWNMTTWRNELDKLGDLPEDIDKLDEFLLQDQYFNGNLTMAEKIFNAPKRHVAQNEGYNATLLAQEFAGYEADVCMSDEAVHDYKQQVAELLEGSWLDLVNGTDLMLHMKDGRVFNCADLLPAGLCKDLIRTFTEEGREAAERELHDGLVALGIAVIALFAWKLTFDKGTTPTVSDGPADGPGGGSGPSGGDDPYKGWTFERKKAKLQELLMKVQNKICELRKNGQIKAADRVQEALDKIIGDTTVGVFVARPGAVTEENIDKLLQRARELVEQLDELSSDEQKKEKKDDNGDGNSNSNNNDDNEERLKEELKIAKQKGQTKLMELTNAINVAGDKGGDALENAKALKTELTNAINGTDASAINMAADKVDGVVNALKAAASQTGKTVKIKVQPKILHVKPTNLEQQPSKHLKGLPEIKDDDVAKRTISTPHKSNLRTKPNSQQSQLKKVKEINEKEEEERKRKERRALEVARLNGPKKRFQLQLAIQQADGKGGDKLAAANELNTNLSNALTGTNANAIFAEINKVDDVIAALNAAVEKARKAEEACKTPEKEKKSEKNEQEEKARKKQEERLKKEAKEKVRKTKEERKKKEKEAAERKAEEERLRKAEEERKKAEEEQKQKQKQKEEEERKALQAATQQGQEKLNALTTAIDEADGKGGDKLAAANELKTELTNAINGPDANAITDSADKVDGVVNALNDAVAAEKKAAEEEERKKAEEERQALETARQQGNGKLTDLNNAINASEGKGGDALENANALKTELTDALKGHDAKAITDAAAKVDGAVKALNEAVEKARKEEEERKQKEQEERKKKEEEERRKKEEEERKQKEKEAAERKAEEERLRKEEEKRKKAEEEQKQKEEEERKAREKAEAEEKARKEEEERKKAEEERIAREKAEEARKKKEKREHEEAERKCKEEEEIREIEQKVFSVMDEGKKNLDYWNEHQNDYTGFISGLNTNQKRRANDRLNKVNEALELARKKEGNAEAIQSQIDTVQTQINSQIVFEKSLNMMGFNANEGSSLLKYFLAVKAELENLKTKPKLKLNTNAKPFVRKQEPKEIKEIKEIKEQPLEEKKEEVTEVKEMKEEIKEKPAEKKEEIKEIKEIKEQQVEEKKEEVKEEPKQEEIEEMQEVHQHQPAVEIPLDVNDRVQAAQAALQTAQAEHDNKELIMEQLMVVDGLIREHRQWLQRQAISNDKILEKLRFIYAELEEMLNELEEQPKEEKEEPKKDGDDNGGQGNGMKEDNEPKDDKKDDEKKDDEKKDEDQEDPQGAVPNDGNVKNQSRVDLAYLANVAKHIPECLFTKENLGAAAGVGVAAATSGIPAAIPAAGVAAIGYNTLKCADEKATMELYHKQSLKNLQESLDRRSIWDRLSPATSEQSDAELMNDLSKKFDEEKRLAANRGDMATLYGYDQNDLNNQVGTHVAMAAPARM